MSQNKMSQSKKVEVVPSISFSEEKQHAFKSLFEDHEENCPILKSVGYGPVPGSNKYVSYVLTSKGRNVIKIEVEEPDVRGIAEEVTKMAFDREFTGVDL